MRTDSAGETVASLVEAARRGRPDAWQAPIGPLHCLAGMAYPEVAAFLGIGLAGAKKGAHPGGDRLKELLPMAADLLAHQRPSRDGRFRDTILLFAAIRRRDRDAVARLLRHDPGLA